MATARQNQDAIRTIKQQIASLRRKLSTWIFVHGMGRWLMIALGVLAFDMVLDRVFKMDLAQRLIMLIIMLAVFAVFFFIKLIRPFGHSIDDDALLMEVEKNNKESRESIISSFQLAQDEKLAEKGFSETLAQATIDQGVSTAKSINFGTALDGERSGKNWMLLLGGAAATTVLAIGVWMGLGELRAEKANEAEAAVVVEASDSENAQSSPLAQVTRFLGIWFNRNIMLGDAQWPQSTYLEIVGAENGEIVVARGSDHNQFVMISDKSSRTQVDVTLEIEGPTGKTIHQMKPTGAADGREHRFVFHNVSAEQRFRATGGDATSEWVKLVLVEPPNVDNLDLQAKLPDYTGLEPMELEGAGPHSLLAGTEVTVTINSNKPLSECSLKVDEELLPLVASNDDRTQYSTILGKDNPLVGGKFDFVLKDDRGLANNRPASFTLKVKEDKRPKVRADTIGISGLVVPRAFVPTKFSVVDDFGLANVEFDCNWTEQSGDETVNQRKIPIFLPKSGEVRTKLEGEQVLELEQLNLKPDTSFRFSVSTTDTNPDTPGFTKSRDFLLRVVTEEELRSDLLRREIEQRKAFQQAYDAQMAAIADLRAVQAMKIGQGVATEEFDTERTKRLLMLLRDQELIGKNITAIATRFTDFLIEVDNNRLDEEVLKTEPERSLQIRFGEQIVKPILNLDQQLISLAKQNLDNCRRTLTNRSEFDLAVQTTTEVQESILQKMREILSAMEESEKFQDIVNKLLEFKRLEERIRTELKGQETPPDDIFEEENGIFDDN